MAGSFGLSGNKSKTGATFGQDVWGPQGEALQSLYQQVGNLFAQSTQGMNNQIPGAVDYANNVASDARNGWNNQVAGGAYRDMDLQNNLMRSLNQSQNSPSAMSEINAMVMGGTGNNYADAMRGQYIQDATDAQNNMLANTDARAAASGMSGGSRHGIVQSQGMADINKNLQSNLARTGYETFDRDLDRKLQIAGQADQANFGRQQMMQQMLGGQQDAMSGALNNSGNMQNLGMGSFNAYMAPWQASNAYTNAVGGPTVLGSGSSSGSSKGGGMNGSVSAGEGGKGSTMGGK